MFLETATASAVNAEQSVLLAPEDNHTIARLKRNDQDNEGENAFSINQDRMHNLAAERSNLHAG
jgi:hypothetical protein